MKVKTTPATKTSADTSPPEIAAVNQPTTSTVGLINILRRMMTLVPAVTIVGTAFLYFAGYTYLDHYRSGFGLAFGATEMSTAEVIATGYTVVMVALIKNVGAELLPLVIPALTGLLFIGVLTIGARLRWRGCYRTLSMIESIRIRWPGFANYLLADA